MKILNELSRPVILVNELDDNEQAALRFSDADGVKSGRLIKAHNDLLSRR
jgi:hypothetical protein